MNKIVTLSVVVIAIIAIGAIYFFNQPVLWKGNDSVEDHKGGEMTLCTQDAKLCPDGSYVGRTGPNCEFAVCPQESASNGVPMTQTKRHEVRMQNNEFVPKELSIKVGDEVVFINDDEAAHWPASGMHPTHLLCAGFDALKGLKQGESYSHMFTEIQNDGVCPVHDHLMPKMFGKITITQ